MKYRAVLGTVSFRVILQLFRTSVGISSFCRSFLFMRFNKMSAEQLQYRFYIVDAAIVFIAEHYDGHIITYPAIECTGVTMPPPVVKYRTCTIRKIDHPPAVPIVPCFFPLKFFAVTRKCFLLHRGSDNSSTMQCTVPPEHIVYR